MVFEYAPAPESTKIVNLKSNYELFIGGKFVKSKAGSNYKTINPATEEVLSEIVEASEKMLTKQLKQHAKHLSLGQNLQDQNVVNIFIA